MRDRSSVLGRAWYLTEYLGATYALIWLVLPRACREPRCWIRESLKQALRKRRVVAN